MKFFTLIVVCCLSAFQSVAQDFLSVLPETHDKALIIGGQPIAISQAPWTVSVKSDLFVGSGSYAHIGGGSIVEPRWILTSASSVLGQQPGNLKIRAGATDQTTGGQLVQVIRIIRHPNFNSATFENDLALLELGTPLVFDANVKSIKYASAATLPDNLMNPGASAAIMGWGATSNGSYIVTNQLNKVDMPVISNATANTMNQGNVPFPGPTIPPVSANMIAVYQSGKGAGNLDGGGPIVIYNGTEPVLAGCSSWSRDPRDQYPSIGTRIKNYAAWLQTNLPAPFAVSISSRVVPQLDDVYRVDFHAGAISGIPPYTYTWSMTSGATPGGMVGASFNGNEFYSLSGQFYDGSGVCAQVRITDASNQVVEARACGNQAESFRAITASSLKAVTYPNPADTYLEIRTDEAPAPQVQLSRTSAATPTSVGLYDAQGTLKYSGTTQNGLLKLDTSTLSEGIYHLQLTQGKTVTKRQIVIRH